MGREAHPTLRVVKTNAYERDTSTDKPLVKRRMPIRVKLHGRLRMAAGSDQIELPESVKNVGDVLDELVQRVGPTVRQYIFDPGTKELSPSLIMLVNGHSIRMLEGLNTPLLEKDVVTVDSVDIMEIVGGG